MPSEAEERTETDAPEPAATVTIYRASEAEPMKSAKERGVVRKDHPVHPATAEGVMRFATGGAGDGAMARILFESEDFHVSYAWFKSGFPLPLHSHDANCFYQIIAGSMTVGTQLLGKGDGVLIPASVPYTVTPGPDGVEFIEIRPTSNYDTRYRGKTEKYWDKIVDTLQARKSVWAQEQAPYGLLQGDRT